MKDPIPEVLDAVNCLQQSGYKTALLTNNWKTASGETLLPFNKSLFDVVSNGLLIDLKYQEIYAPELNKSIIILF